MAKILIVDDEPHIRLLLEQILEDFEDEGVDILSCDNGKDAVEIIKQEKPDLIFLDILMPQMNGFDVCRAVKKELKMDDVYIILLTARGHGINMRKGIEAGADLCISKPFDPAEIIEHAVRVLGLEIN